MEQVKLSENKWGKKGGYNISNNFQFKPGGGKDFWGRGNIEWSEDIDGHHVIYFYGPDKRDSDIKFRVEILWVGHDSEEIPDRLYECAVAYTKNLAELYKAEFINMTERHKQESELEVSVSS